jgi:NTE family protein
MAERARDTGVALALSGGGFRATLFHVGGLWRLNELRLLHDLQEVTSVSGGSITSAWLALQWNNLVFDQSGVATNFQEIIANPLRKFCSRTCDIPTVLKGWINPFRRPSHYLARYYRKTLFGDATLQDLPAAGPRFTIYATNLLTGVSVRMERNRLADYRIGEIKNPRVPLATAVAASSAFPPLFVPLKLKTDPSSWSRFEGADLFDNPQYRGTMYLGDGGIYDNMGLERIWDTYETVLVSDAGAPFADLDTPGWLRFSQVSRLLRTLAIIDRQSRSLRRRWLVRGYQRKEMNGTFWGIATDIDKYRLADAEKPGAMVAYSDGVKSFGRMRTRLNCFSAQEQGSLINWGYALADAALRADVVDPGVPAGTWPVPEYPLT